MADSDIIVSLHLVIPFTSMAGKLGQNDITWGQVNSTGVPTDQKSKQS
jgi:hypothetical protein